MAKKTESESGEASQEGADLLTVTELAKAHGHFQSPQISGDSPFSPHHAAADVLNGWRRHDHFQGGGEIKLSHDNYLGAIEAAKNGKPFAPANLRPLTIHTKEQAEAFMAQANKGAR